MDKVSVEGKEYVKAASVARELGYTRDYIGQLCRAKKIDAQLVGRSWYVYVPSLEAHKKSRYQSVRMPDSLVVSTEQNTAAISKTFLESEAVSENKMAKSVLANIDKGSEARNHYEERLARFGSPKYYTDENDLFPSLTKNPSLRMTKDVDDSVELKITPDDDEPNRYAPQVSKEVEKPLKGKLSVQDLSVSKLNGVEKSSKNKHILVKNGEFAHKKMVNTTTAATTTPVKNDGVQSFAARIASQKVGPRPEDEFPELIQSGGSVEIGKNRGLSIPVPMSLSVVAGAVIFALAVGVSWNLDMDNNDTDSGYRFNISSVIEAK